MAASNPKNRTYRRLAPALGLMLAAAAGPAASPSPKPTPEVISLDAQSSEIDLATNNVVFRKVRIVQGNMSVSADQGQATRQATGLNFDNSLWVFRGNVKIA